MYGNKKFFNYFTIFEKENYLPMLAQETIRTKKKLNPCLIIRMIDLY